MTIYAGFIYPVVAHWAWDVGYGWLVEGVTYSNETIAYQVSQYTQHPIYL
jgi:ammonia channel protein AmtB